MEQDWFEYIGSHQETVQQQWIDYNGHLNLAYYVLIFDRASDKFLDAIGAGESYRNKTGNSSFALEMHVNYLHEVRLGQHLRVSTQLLDHDHKRVHLFHHMLLQSDNRLVATTELMLMHVTLADLRSSPWPPTVTERLATVTAKQKLSTWPPQAGRKIGIQR